MKAKLVQSKYRTKSGGGCKLCKPHKGGYENIRTVRDFRQAMGHVQQIEEQG